MNLRTDNNYVIEAFASILRGHSQGFSFASTNQSEVRRSSASKSGLKWTWGEKN